MAGTGLLLPAVGLSGLDAAVEAVLMNILSDQYGEQVFAEVAGLEVLAQVGGGSIHVHAVQEMDALAVGGGEGHALGVAQGEAGAADDDPFSEIEEFVRTPPTGEAVEAVGADEVEDGGCRQGLVKAAEGFDGEVRFAAGDWGVQGGGGESGIGGTGQRYHGEAVCEGRGRAGGLEGLAARWGEEDGVELEGVSSGSGYGEMAEVWGVEGAAEQGDAGRGFYVVRVYGHSFSGEAGATFWCYRNCLGRRRFLRFLKRTAAVEGAGEKSLWWGLAWALLQAGRGEEFKD